MANDNTNGRIRWPALFTEKVVGLAFAISFGLWAWYLDGLADTVLDAVNRVTATVEVQRAEMAAIKAELASLRIDVSRNQATLMPGILPRAEERIQALERRLNSIEKRHGQNGSHE